MEILDEGGEHELLDRAAQGDVVAVEQLLAMHRDRLKRMISLRLDPRVAVRADGSDVLQETLLIAARKLPDYLKGRPLPFYPWLHQIAWEQLLHLHRRHIQAQKRSVLRERQRTLDLPDQSAVQLADLLMAVGSSPSQCLARHELRQRMRHALDNMPWHDREVLVMRYLEQLSVHDIAAILGLTESGVKSRHRRALERLHGNLEDEFGEP